MLEYALLEVKRIKLYEHKEEASFDGYELNPFIQYELVDIERELEIQASILDAFLIMGAPPALKNYHAWLFKNGFSYENPNPTNEFVAQYYGAGPLWKTEYSQGLVVKVEGDEDFYIIMECSTKNRGYKHTKVILTVGGCL